MNVEPHYWLDPMKNKFEINIESIMEANGTTYVTINKPVVKPTSGGQAGDRGFLEIGDKRYEFTNTANYNNATALVMKMVPKNKGPAILHIDMNWRFSMMRHHTSEHIFVGILKQKYPETNLGRIWIDGDHGTIILEGGLLSYDQTLEAEADVQEHIREAIPVTTELVKAEDIDETIRAREGITSKHNVLRIVKVGELDSSACSGIHVTNTSEIQIFKVIDIKHQENNTYIEFISGPKAIKALCHAYNLALVRKHDYPFEIEQLGAILDKAKSVQASFNLLVGKVQQLMTQGPQREQIGEIEFWHEFLPGLDSNSLRQLLKEIKIDQPSIVLFFAPGVKSNLVLWTNAMPEDASYYIKEKVVELGGRGGGSRDSYTGGFTDVEEPEILYERIVNYVRDRILER
ncbi:MAG: alanyl-tRNA editing protein [Candidatus Thorarchaeota archaeon]|nr:alanyl-tRNA editing protein [Candidatus Thorarchaeota archaeon]